MKSKVFDMTDRELLIRIDERVKSLQIKFASICTKNKNLEKRVNKLEQWKMYVVGAAGVVGAVVTLLGNKIIESVWAK